MDEHVLCLRGAGLEATIGRLLARRSSCHYLNSVDLQRVSRRDDDDDLVKDLGGDEGVERMLVEGAPRQLKKLLGRCGFKPGPLTCDEKDGCLVCHV